MKVLITGSNGMLGQDLIPVFEDTGAFVIETNRNNLDITNEAQVIEFCTENEPDIIIHSAAFTNVDLAESELDTARLINSKGTENLAKICKKLDIPIVYISTDYVFDGTKTTPYTPEDKTNPLNNYGFTKLEGEAAVKKNCEKYYIVRTSWLFGHYGKNFVETMIALSKTHKEIKVINDTKGCPTWTVELANGIVNLLNKPFGTYHICGSGETTWFGLAEEVFKLTNTDVKLIPCTAEEMQRVANRPKYSVMDNNKSCRNWKVALKEYIELRFDEDEDFDEEMELEE